ANVEDIQAAAASDERKRIARHLHDTLGQSLAYLQLKLTNLSTDDSLADITIFHQDLERMRDITNEAYEQVRQSVLIMQTDNNINLSEALVDQAKSTARQAELGLHYVLEGQPQELPPIIQRKILFIFREALHNVQRHAQATAVHLAIVWDADAVTVELCDNGVGFNSQNGAAHGHFGLLIMAQRAEEINARLMVTAVPGQGAKVSLHYPLTAGQELAARVTDANGYAASIPE
ncbi:MAG TPA: histidine kinase, partial [Chloroflexota bacterium]|nr:histidine kinase [Chloroflexota bacterium]